MNRASSITHIDVAPNSQGGRRSLLVNVVCFPERVAGAAQGTCTWRRNEPETKEKLLLFLYCSWRCTTEGSDKDALVLARRMLPYNSPTWVVVVDPLEPPARLKLVLVDLRVGWRSKID